MGRKAVERLDPGTHHTSVWIDGESRNLLFDIAKAEERSVQVIMRRALAAYAETSEEHQRARHNQKLPKRQAA